MSIGTTRVVKFIRKGDKGEDSITYSVMLSPASVFVDANDKTDIANITATAYKTVGKNRAVATDGTMYLRFVNSAGTESRVVSNGLVTNGAISYRSVQFEYQVSGTIVATAALQINRQGQTGGKGDRGPALRGPQAWSDCANGYAFQAGGNGEAWKDVVMYGNNYYSCIKSHSKSATNYPGSTNDQNNKYWQLGDKIELVATKILLATYALVKNLGVECIDMKDAKGNVLFQAKDGNVTCKTGTFENIKVSGDITAEYLNLKTSTANHSEDNPTLANGAICNGASGIILPELPQGTARSMRVLNPLFTRTPPLDLVLKPASANVYISKSLSWLGASNSTVTLNGRGYNAGSYLELLGIREKGSSLTYWLMSEMNQGLIS